MRHVIFRNGKNQPKQFPTLDAASVCRASGQQCSGINPAKCLANFNNFILTLNASASFVVYCFVGTFGNTFAEVLTSCCNKKSDDQNRSSRVRLDNLEMLENGAGKKTRRKNGKQDESLLKGEFQGQYSLGGGELNNIKQILRQRLQC